MALERHHRKPKYYGGDNKPQNIKMVSRERHRAFHCVFTKNGRPMDPHEIAVEINSWIDPEWMLIPQRKPKMKWEQEEC